MPFFSRYIGIDYSGAETPNASLKGLRVYLADDELPPVEVQPPPSPRKYWTRRGVAEWLTDRLAEDAGRHRSRLFVPAALFRDASPQARLVRVPRRFPAPLAHGREHLRRLRSGRHRGKRECARAGNARWRRLTEEWSGSAKSVFHFDVQGSVAKSTHAGIPWLRFIRQRVGERVHF
jgi:hypothetical protein